jgi:hypothetical protein
MVLALQVVSQDGATGLDELRCEYVVRVKGQLRVRKDPNPRVATGMVELVAEEVFAVNLRNLSSIAAYVIGHRRVEEGQALHLLIGVKVCVAQVTLLNAVNTKLPYLPSDEETDVKEEVRLRTRILDLRHAATMHLTAFFPARCWAVSGRCNCHPLVPTANSQSYGRNFMGIAIAGGRAWRATSDYGIACCAPFAPSWMIVSFWRWTHHCCADQPLRVPGTS